MADPTKTTAGRSPATEKTVANRDQKTLLLSDVPDAATLVDTPSVPAFQSANLTSNSLAALSGRYDILDEAGHGNMGNVYKARDRETGETVALKLLKPEIASDQAMMERFKNELLFARKITHKNVCRVHDFNRIGGIAYTSMEYVEGESLRSVLNRFGAMQPRKGMDLALQICSGLKEAHAQGIVHRDLKPENVMIDTRGNVKIMDFGIARSMEAATRLTGSMVGTPAYMAPEQVAGKSIDYRADIYSLGLILYEMFTGAQAFHADTPVAVALKQLREEPPAPHEIEPNIPATIERTILRCLQKDPGHRFQSIGELESALRGTGVANQRSGGLAAPIPTPGASRPFVPMSAVTPIFSQPPVRTKSTSPVTWLFLGAATVLGALAGLHELQVMKTAQQITAPTQVAAPKPPEFALANPKAQPDEARPADVKPADAKSANANSAVNSGDPKSVAPKPTTPAAPAKAKTPDVFPKREIAPPKKTWDSPDAVPSSNPAAPTPAQSSARQNAQAAAAYGQDVAYLWVGRFAREDRAQATAKRIEDLGLPVVVIPKDTPNGIAFIVCTGPFGATRIASVTQWLEAQGFSNVRLIPNPYGKGGNRNGNGGGNGAPIWRPPNGAAAANGTGGGNNGSTPNWKPPSAKPNPQ